MATTLLQALQGGLANPLGSPSGFGAPPTQTGAQATQQVGDLLRAKTGRAVNFGGSTPRMSSVGADVAASNAAAQLAQTQQQGQVQAQQVGTQFQAQADQASLAQAQVAQAATAQKQKFANQASDLIQQYKQAGRQIDLDQDKATAEQLGFLTRLSDDKYVTHLQQVGELNRLQDANNFQEATVNAVFGAQLEALKGRLSNEDLLNQDANAWREKTGQLDLNWAMKTAEIARQSANTQALYTGAGNLASAGASGYSTYSSGGLDSDYDHYKQYGGTLGYDAWQEEGSPKKPPEKK